MTPKEKAKELVKKYYKYSNSTDCRNINDNTYTSWKKEFFTNNEMWKNNAKQCALICVDEIIYSYPTDPFNTLQPTGIKALDYWREVKQEIEKL